jgi:RHS repeat-associated protein
MIRQVMNGVTTNFTYSDLDLLTNLSAPGRTETYRYNGHGHRIERTVNSVATRYLVEPNGTMPNMLAELSNTNSPQRFYVHGANGLLSQIDAAGTYHAYHFAPIGNTTALTDVSGNVSDTYAYLPYGETFAGAGNATTNPFKFVGRFGVMDEGNGLQYMRARYYKPDAGRFMSLDAIAGDSAEPQSLNRTAYALGNPSINSDPTGLWSWASVSDSVTNWEKSFVENSNNQVSGIFSEVILAPGISLGENLGSVIYDLTHDEVSVNTAYAFASASLAPLNATPVGIAVNSVKGTLKGSINGIVKDVKDLDWISSNSAKKIKKTSAAAIDFGSMFISAPQKSAAQAWSYLKTSNGLTVLKWAPQAYSNSKILDGMDKLKTTYESGKSLYESWWK